MHMYTHTHTHAHAYVHTHTKWFVVYNIPQAEVMASRKEEAVETGLSLQPKLEALTEDTQQLQQKVCVYVAVCTHGVCIQFLCVLHYCMLMSGVSLCSCKRTYLVAITTE